MRITYCPLGHRVVVEADVYTHSACVYCMALIMQKKPVKAKRSGES